MCTKAGYLAGLALAVLVTYAAPSEAASGGAESGLFTIDNRDGTGLRLLSLSATYQGVFAEGVDVINTFTATVDWAGKTPSKVVYQLNGANRDVPTSGSSAQTTYNMGDDLGYALTGVRNDLRAWAVAADGTASQPMKLDLWGLALPEWAISSESKKGPINWRLDPLTGKIAFYGEVEVLKGGIQGTVNIPNSIPEVGGKWGVEIDPLNFTWELAAQPRFGDGAGLTGTFDLGGWWEAEASCGTKRKGSVKAGISGEGEFYPQLKLTDVSAELAGSFTFLFPRVPLLCQWTGCCHTGYCPYFQASIKPEITGTVGMEEGEPSLVAGLKFKNAELNIGVTVAGTVGAGSEGSIYYIAGTIGGKPYIILQFPGNVSSSCLNEYIKEIGFELQARFVVECAWWKKEYEWTFNIYQCPETGMSYAVMVPAGLIEVVPVEREYLTAGEAYCAFPSLKGGVMAMVGGLPAPILNVGTGPLPSVAATANDGLLLFVYDDATKPTGKHQEIYWARWDGAQWTAHAPLTDNLRPDLYPAAAIDAAGKGIAAWVQAPEPTGAETGPRDILPGTEIVFAKYDAVGGVWSTSQAITTNAYADLLPWFEKRPDGSLRLLWISSPTNAIPVWHDEEIAPSLDVMASDWTGATFGVPYVVASDLQTVTPPSVTRTATHELLTYLLDADDNSGTGEDREVMVRVRPLGGAWVPDVRLTTDAYSDTAAQIAVDQNGVPMVTWVKRLVPKPVPDGEDTHVDQLWFARWNGAGWDAPVMTFEAEGIAEPRLIRNEAGRLLLFWVATSEEFSDIYYCVFDAGRVQWGQPQQLTHDEGAEAMISLAESGGDILAAYVKRRVDLTSDPNGLPLLGLSDLYLLKHLPARNLSVGAADITFDPSPPVRGADVTVCASVRLGGDFTVADVLVEFYDGDPDAAGVLIGSDTIEALLPGDFGQACVTWTVPDDGQSHEVHVLVDPAGIIPESSESDNRASTKVFKPDLKVGGLRFLGNPTADSVLVGVSVRNAGNAASGPSVCEVRKDSETGELLFTAAVPSLAPNASTEAQFNWNVTTVAKGVYTLVAKADSAGQVDELNEANNLVVAPVPVQADLRAEQWSVRARPGLARMIVRNVGVKPSAGKTVRVLKGGLTLGEAAVSALNVGAEEDVMVLFTGADLGDTLDLVANPDSDGSDEVTLLNNAALVLVDRVPGDVDLDGHVDVVDLLWLVDAFGSLSGDPNFDPRCDFNSDGSVDVVDLLYMVENFGT
jgi:hypothetical protein